MNCTCLPAPEAASSRDSCSDTAASAPSRSTPTAAASSPTVRLMARSRRSRSSPMSEPSMLDPTPAELTSWLADFPARTSASPAREPASTASGLGSGERWRGLLATFDPGSCSWKTVQHSLLADSASSSVTWPRSGMTVGGRCYQRPTSMPRTCGSVSGSSGNWPTPTAQDNAQVAGQYRNPRSGTTLGGAVRMFPTPKATDGAKGGPNSIHGSGSLSLPAFAARFPTPAASGYRTAGQPGMRRGQLTDPAMGAIGPGGRLNPEWVEWLMGWPVGHTASGPLATVRYREWLQQHSPCWPASSRAEP